MIEYVDKNVQRLLHMIVGIKRLNRMLDGMTKEAFAADERTQDAVAFDISTIGESAANISDNFDEIIMFGRDKAVKVQVSTDCHSVSMFCFLWPKPVTLKQAKVAAGGYGVVWNADID